MTMLEYANKFNELGRFCPQLMEFERSKANRFEQGLKYEIRSRLFFHILNNYKDVLERALKVESELKKTDLERGDRKRARSAENLKDQQKNFKNNNSDKKKESIFCSYCEKNHNGSCLKRIGACFLCGEKGYMARDCPNKKKDDSRPNKPVDQKQKENARVFALNQQEANASDQVVTGTILVNSIHAHTVVGSCIMAAAVVRGHILI
ncbi:uncharacterized protein [Elaeis guineensis]|uniref:uncharacterized protein n=1 Tax=Elaeis guineensis var. tenera TaxID=51953 RepID=UPI003C6CE2EF